MICSICTAPISKKWMKKYCGDSCALQALRHQKATYKKSSKGQSVEKRYRASLRTKQPKAFKCLQGDNNCNVEFNNAIECAMGLPGGSDPPNAVTIAFAKQLALDQGMSAEDWQATLTLARARKCLL